MNDHLRLLLVEDAESDAKLVLRELRRTWHTIDHERVEDAPGMREALGRRHWDVVTSDWSMPKFSGLEALAVLQETRLDIPFVIVSGTVGEELAAEAMRHGAQDYVLKERLSRLAPAVERELRDAKARGARRRAEQSLRESEARFARLSEAGIVAICSVDVFGNVSDANEAFLKLLGYSPEDLSAGAVNLASRTPPEWRASDERATERLRSHGVAHPWEKELLRRDGTPVPVLMGVAVLDYPNCIAFLADLTARKQTEAALRQTEAQLRHAQKMEAIGSLAGGIAHDFNNLLTVILSYSALLAMDLPLGDSTQVPLEEIQLAGRRAADLTRQLLAFSRQQVLQPRLVDLNEVIAPIDRMLRRLLGADIQLVTRRPAELGQVMVDPGQIEQLIMNLAVNARDAMPDGGKLTIEPANIVLDDAFVATCAGASPGPHVLLAVTDTGTGMDDTTKTRIFEPFFTTKEPGKGTGLGLSTVFGIVKQSGGHIAVDSEPGRGTTFRLYFPLATGTEREGVVVAEPLAPAVMHGPDTSPPVEDES